MTTAQTRQGGTDAAHIAGTYIHRGWAVVPIPHMKKSPLIKGWQNLQLTEAELPTHFNGKPMNIGVLLGEPSGWRVDVDVDHPEAVALARKYLPPTDARFGRESKPESHWEYCVTGAIKTTKFQTANSAMLVELRSTGCQTVFPGSTHPSGEAVRWDADGEPALIDPAELLEAAQRLAESAAEQIGETLKRPAPAMQHRPPMQTTGNADRAWKYINKMTAAIAGQGGHNATYNVACECFRFGLSDEDTRQLLRRFNAEKCSPPWTEKELDHKLADARVRVMADGEFGSRLTEHPGKVKESYTAQVKGANDAAPILDPSDPLPTARELIGANFTAEQYRIIHHHRGEFFVWTGNHYELLGTSELRAAIYRFTEKGVSIISIGGGKTKQVPFKPTKNRIDNIFDALIAAVILPSEIDPPAWIDSQPGDSDPSQLVAMRNGLYDLPTGKLCPHTPRLLNRNALDFDFDPDATMPGNWLHFLSQLWPTDDEAVRALRQWFGYCLTSDTRQQKILLLIGPKRSGKGTIARILSALVGKANVSAPTLAGMSVNFGLAPLIDKSLAIISDARLSGRADQAVIAERLLSISGEDAITIDRKYRPAWTGRLPTRFMVLTNELPRLADASGALASRFIVLTLTQSFYGHEDHGLTDRLMGELSGIFNWAVDGWRDLQQVSRFITPASSTDAIAELEDLGSPIGAFIRERCIVEPGRSIEAGRLFEAWRGWCEAQGREHAGTIQTFGRDLHAAMPGLRTSRPRVEGTRLRFWEGIDLERI
ncbi:MAG: phage/plasmid primase, P4 family [Phycisphaerales bacterium]